MRRSCIAIIFFLLVNSGAVLGQSYDLRFVVFQHDKMVGGDFDVIVQIKANTNTFGMGTSNLVFEYNMVGLTGPTLAEIHNYSGEFYNDMTMTEPIPGRLSLNIELFIPDFGTEVLTEYQDVATIHFEISSSSQTSNLAWRTDSPNETAVFDDDLISEITQGTLNDLDIRLGYVLSSRPGPSEDLTFGGGLLAIPAEFKLYQNYPNPFNPATTLRFDIPILVTPQANARLAVYDIMGQLITTLYDGPTSPGIFEVEWNGLSDIGLQVPSGIYFADFRSEQYQRTIRMTLVK